MKFFKKIIGFLKKVVRYTFAFMLIIGAALVAVISYFSASLPDYHQLEQYDPAALTRIYAYDGEIMEEYATENRIFLQYKDIPRVIIQAFISAEDKNFFNHYGIDFFSILRASVQNILNLSQKKGPVGGSTITQQVVKNFLLTNERTISRKIKEAILAYRITKTYSKERILELYLNQIFLGNNSYGVASAALNYFNKDVNDISLEEAAVLAALPKAPSKINPFTNYNRALVRRNWIIDNMLDMNFISNQVAQDAKARPILLHKRRTKFVPFSTYYTQTVRGQMLKSVTEDELYTRGYRIFTYLDPELQKIASKALRAGIERYDRNRPLHFVLGNIAHTLDTEDWIQSLNAFVTGSDVDTDGYELAVVLKIDKHSAIIGTIIGHSGELKAKDNEWLFTHNNQSKTIDTILRKGDVIAVKYNEEGKVYTIEQIPEINGGIIVMEVGSGRVLAMTGGYSMFGNFNRVTQALRQPGSLFKPFVYLTAIENGYSMADIINDEPLSLSQGNGTMWRPKNYTNTFLGPITLRQALEKSRNIPTIKLAIDLGVHNIAQTAIRLGIYKKPFTNLSSALGSCETTLLNAVTAYNIIANYGAMVRPKFIHAIYDRNGEMIFSEEYGRCYDCDVSIADPNAINIAPATQYEYVQVIDPGHAYEMISLLEGVVKRGTAKKAKSLNMEIAGKTGTTNDSKDLWFIGFNKNIVVGVYIGYDTPKAMGKKDTGATVALPIFIDFMQKAESSIKASNFEVPKDLIQVQVDYSTGKETTSGSNSITEYFTKEQYDRYFSGTANDQAEVKDKVDEHRDIFNQMQNDFDDKNAGEFLSYDPDGDIE